MAYKKWVVKQCDKDKAERLSEKYNIDIFVSYLLVSRGFDDSESVGTFLGSMFYSVSPFKFRDMDRAVLAINTAIDNNDKICIYGDYDCDGVTSTALLYSFLKEKGADVFYYIPSRKNEGYGLNNQAIDYISAEGTKLVITVDNGINSVNEAEYIYSLGMKLVVTDHHQLGNVLPKAEAVVNPYREENELDFRDYCGVGVVFKLVCAINGSSNIDALVDKYMDLVAIGTIADVVPLIDENRAFVKAGLNLINNNPRPSVRAYKADAKKNTLKKEYTSNDIAFQLCPRINAMGRMDDANIAVDYLLEEDYKKCQAKFSKLSLANSERQNVERSILEDVERSISENPKLLQRRVLVFVGKGYHNGVVGIVASHIVEKYSKPAIIIGVDDEGIARGSARSIEGFNIYEAISYCKEDLIRFGGHPLAAGVTLEEGKLDSFIKHINDFAFERFSHMPAPVLNIDCVAEAGELSLGLVHSLKTLEPFGCNNPQPVFGLFNLKIIEVSPLSSGKHIRLTFDKDGAVYRAVMFNRAYDEFPYSTGDRVNLAVKISDNYYRESHSLSIQGIDIHLSSLDEDKFFNEKNDYEDFLITKKGDVTLYPTREVCAYIYKYLKRLGEFGYTLDELYFRVQNNVNYSQLIFALKAFEEAGLIEINDKIRVLPAKRKVRLEDTAIFKSLRERLNIE